MRRDAERSRRWGGLAAAQAAVFAAGVVALVAGGGFSMSGSQAAAGIATPAAAAQSIAMHDIFYDPAALTVPAYLPVHIGLANVGAARHSFVIGPHNNSGLPDLGIVVDLGPGESGEAVVSAPPGTYYFYCDEPGHEAAGMHGLLTVR